MLELPRPRPGRQRRPREAGVVPERRHAAARVVGQKLEVEQGAAAAGEARQHRLPAGLVLVAVRELDVGVYQRDFVLGGWSAMPKAEEDRKGEARYT